MLVEVDGVTVTNMNAGRAEGLRRIHGRGCAGGDLRVDDYLDDPLDNTYAVATPFSKIIGIAGWSFNERKMFPRSTADLVP